MPVTKSTRTIKSSAYCGFVTDMENRRYTLTTFIGQGGQGSVYAVKEGRLAVKLLHSSNAAEREQLHRRIQAVKRLDLAGLPIASPVAVLRPPHVGYVMPLAAGMSPLRCVITPPADGRSVSQWYLATGGLRGRLRLLGVIADIFSRLHGRGLAYGDPSPANILLGSVGESPSAFLIDADNLHTSGGSSRAALYTPGYGAPELMRGESGPNTLTDAHSIAVMAFELLTLIHPFVGDRVHDGEPELEERAFRGELPWIEHGSDASNRSSRGIDRKFVLSPALRQLFTRTFESGLQDILVRPGVSEWAEAFVRAADVAITCPRCHSTYYAPGAKACAWCDAEVPKLGFARFLLWDPEAAGPDAKAKGDFVRDASQRHRSLASLVLAAKSPIEITYRHVRTDVQIDQAAQSLVELNWTGSDSLRIRNLSKQNFLLVCQIPGKRSEQEFAAGTEQQLLFSRTKPQWGLHFGPLDTLHRVAVFEAPK